MDELEAEGLVDRGPDPSDRRAHVVSLTKERQRRHARGVADIRVVEDRLLSALSATELRHLETALPRLIGEPIQRLAGS